MHGSKITGWFYYATVNAEKPFIEKETKWFESIDDAKELLNSKVTRTSYTKTSYQRTKVIRAQGISDTRPRAS